MTKREFDQDTRRNFGGRMASDERASYYRCRLPKSDGKDFIVHRAQSMRLTRRYVDLPTLHRKSKFRSVAAYRRAFGKPLLFL